MATPKDLPQEIMVDIFSRLPIKSVGKCRCLSKLWRTHLSTPQFIKIHLLKTHEPTHHLLLIATSRSLHSISSIKNGAVSTKLKLPSQWEFVLGCCDGLVLLETEMGDKFLLNPLTLQQKKLPDSPLALPRRKSFSMYGFGYDSSTDDFKVVTVSYQDTISEQEQRYLYGGDFGGDFDWDFDDEFEPYCIDYSVDSLEAFVDVYSVKSGVWKRVESSPFVHAPHQLVPGAFVNGVIHWLATRRGSESRRSVIAAFNLADEAFDEVPVPKEADLGEFIFSNKLVVLDGCLCLIESRAMDSPIDI